MSPIREILTSPDPDNLGLIPFLSQHIGGDWDRFQLRPWDFATAQPPAVGQLLTGNDQRTGFRWGVERRVRNGERSFILTREIRLGYVISHPDALEAQILAAELSDLVGDIVDHWGCCTQHLEKCISESEAGYVYAPNPTISSGNELGWAIAVARRCEIQYYLESRF